MSVTDRRLNIWLDAQTYDTLKVLADKYALSFNEVIVRCVNAAQFTMPPPRRSMLSRKRDASNEKFRLRKGGRKLKGTT